MSSEDRGRRAEVWDQIDRLEGVKDFVVGFLQAAPVRDPSTREVWIRDANEAFFEVVAAYDMASSKHGAKEDRSSNALSFLETAKGRVNKVSSQLKAFKKGVADDLSAQFQEAFAGVSIAIVGMTGAAAPVRGQSYVEKTIVRVGEDHYALVCSSCGKQAAVFRVDVSRPSSQGERAILFEGITRAASIDMNRAKKVFERLEEGNLRTLNDYVEHLLVGGVDAYCPSCDKAYCKEHYRTEEVREEGLYEATYGTCPEGHRRLLNDRASSPRR